MISFCICCLCIEETIDVIWLYVFWVKIYRVKVETCSGLCTSFNSSNKIMNVKKIIKKLPVNQLFDSYQIIIIGNIYRYPMIVKVLMIWFFWNL